MWPAPRGAGHTAYGVGVAVGVAVGVGVGVGVAQYQCGERACHVDQALHGLP